MNLFVNAEDLGAAERRVICHDPKCALEVGEDEKATGCEVRAARLSKPALSPIIAL
jgi:hypothetical protein